MKHFKFGFSDNFKFICREDFSKNQILSFYRPNTTISKLFFWSNAYRLFSKITLKEKEHYRINSQTLFLLKGNNKKEQKFITQTELSLNYIEKWAYLENPGHLKIKKEIKNLKYLKENEQIYIHERFQLPTLISDGINNDKYVFFKTKKLNFYKDSSHDNLDLEFLRFYFNEFSLKNTFKHGNIYKTLLHGDLTPWNVKVFDTNYIIIDWEEMKYGDMYCDIIHYQFSYFFFKKRLRKEECIRKIKSINLFDNKEYYKSIQKYISVQNDKHT